MVPPWPAGGGARVRSPLRAEPPPRLACALRRGWLAVTAGDRSREKLRTGVPPDTRAPDSGVTVIPRKPAPCGPPPLGLRIGEWRSARLWGAAESCLWGDCSPSVPRSELGLWAVLGTPRREFPSCLSFVPSEREIGRAGGGGVVFGARGRCVCSGTKPSGDLGWGRGRRRSGSRVCMPLPKFDRATPRLAGSPPRRA